jgi:predicted transcriptional regulator
MAASTIELVSDIVSNFVAHNSIGASELPSLIRSIYSALNGVDKPETPVIEPDVRATPAQIRRSISDDGLVSFIDGKKYKTLKRHLSTHGLTVAEYKSKFGLPNDYPTTSPAYSAARSAMAKSLGLGRLGGRVKVAVAKPKGARGRPLKNPAV